MYKHVSMNNKKSKIQKQIVRATVLLFWLLHSKIQVHISMVMVCYSA